MYESYINKIEDVGKLRNLKPGTIRTYQNNVKDFLKFINKHPDELTCEDARDFLLFLKNKGNKSSTLNNKNGALVFFYKRVLGKYGMTTLFQEQSMTMLSQEFLLVLK